MTDFLKIVKRSLVQLATRPLYLYCMILLPVFMIFFLVDMMAPGLPENAPAGIIDMDNTNMSRQVARTLNSMQLVDLTEQENSYQEALEDVKEGKTFGFFLIPENYQQDLLAGRSPVISFYSNMTYFVPGTLLYKNFKTTAVYTKAGTISNMLQQSTGTTQNQITPLINPINVVPRPIGNPWLNYSYYLCNGFVPGVLELMIFLLTVYTVLHEIKDGTSRQWLEMAHGSILKALVGKLLPQTIIWCIMALAMESWLFAWNEFPMNGSWLWLTLGNLLFVLASQGFGLFVCAIMPNLRMALSICALCGILAFSLAAFSFPVPSMYGAVGIFSYILPVRYYYLIYINQALDGAPLFYARFYFIALIAFTLIPLPFLPHLKKHLLKPVYLP